MIITKSDFHSNPFSGFGHTASQKSSLLGVILLRPELRPFIIMIPLSRPFVMHSIIHMFNTSVKPYTLLDQHFNPQFIHYTKCAKYAFLLLFSICAADDFRKFLKIHKKSVISKMSSVWCFYKSTWQVAITCT